VILFTLFLMLVNVTAGKTIYVDIDRPGGDGTTWENAHKYLWVALSLATSGDEIRVAQGTYTPNPADGREATFQLYWVWMKGGYAGYGEDQPDDRDVNVYKTILSGDLSGNDVPVSTENLPDEPSRAENSYHVVTCTGTDASLDGFTVTGGNANGTGYPHNMGAGLFNENSFVGLYNCIFEKNGGAETHGGGVCNVYDKGSLIAHCIFRHNIAYLGGAVKNIHSNPMLFGDCKFLYNKTPGGDGAGMYNLDTNSMVINCTFNANSADCGGGMYNINSTPRVENCTFDDNDALHSGGAMYNNESNPKVTGEESWFTYNRAYYGQGGGVYNLDSEPHIADCHFRWNYAHGAEEGHKGGGGGMCNISGKATVVNCDFIWNKATNDYSPDGGYGGGMLNIECNPDIQDCRFLMNRALYNGGGMSSYENSSPRVVNCTFEGNCAGGSGGGMAVRYSSSPTLVNCLFRENYTEESGWYGGGGFSSDFHCQPSIINCTFTDNTSAGTGGALHGSNYGMSVINCILWGNSAVGGGPEIALWNGCSLSISYCDVQGGSGAVYSGDGTPVTWGDGMMDVDPRFKDIEGRLSWSPCVNAGNNTACDVTTDLDGNPRIVNGVIDMGAYEYQQVFPDDDGDGIENSIDTLPDIFSSDFADAAGTSGSIGDRTGVALLFITDETDPAGVRIKAQDTHPMWAEVTVCGGTVLEFTMGDEAVITCGSVEIEVISGPVEITFTATDGTVATTSLDASNSLVAEPDSLTITTPLTNDQTVVIRVDGQEYTLAPGETFDIMAPMIGDVSANPDTLWPPNHKMVEVLISGSVIDEGTGIEQVRLVVWDEYGELTSDFCDITDQVNEEGEFNVPIELIAWRDGEDLDGRLYTIGVCAIDNAGNETNSDPIEVIVPHNQGKGKGT